MKLWTKILLAVQLLFMVFFIVMAQIQAAEAEKQTLAAQVQSEMAIEARREAQRQAEKAAAAMAMAEAAQREAQNQAELARAQLEECVSKK